MLEMTSFKKTIGLLNESLKCYNHESLDVPVGILRDSVILRLKCTYELSWKMIKRWLEINLGSSHIDGISRRELFRYAAESHLISDPLTL